MASSSLALSTTHLGGSLTLPNAHDPLGCSRTLEGCYDDGICSQQNCHFAIALVAEAATQTERREIRDGASEPGQERTQEELDRLAEGKGASPLSTIFVRS